MFDTTVKEWYINGMQEIKSGETIQKMTIYFPSSLLEKVYESARKHKRSFNKQVLWLVENGVTAIDDNSSKVTVEK